METNEQSQYRLVAEMSATRIAEAERFEDRLKLLLKLKQGISEVIGVGYKAS